MSFWTTEKIKEALQRADMAASVELPIEQFIELLEMASLALASDTRPVDLQSGGKGGAEIPEIPPEELCPYNSVEYIGPFALGWSKCREFVLATHQQKAGEES